MIWFSQPSLSDSSSAYTPKATLAASSGSFAWLETEKAEPPQLTYTGLLGSHCGIGAVAHTPASAPSPTPAPCR
jgi:hypothetical protein